MSLVPVGYLGESGFCGDGNIHRESTVFLYSFSTSTSDGGSTMVRTDDFVFGTDIERCIDAPNSETYRIVVDGKKVGGVILKIDMETHHNELEILFVSPEAHSKGIGYGAWLAVEALHPETVVWETCTPYFEKRNIHFYVNKCGFQIDQFWGEYFEPEHEMPDDEDHDPDEGPDEMFRFIKVMK